MRKDMSKVIVERPRKGSRDHSTRKGYNKNLNTSAKNNFEDAHTKEGMKFQKNNDKELNEHLSPLRRFLRSKVGQHWDKVFSEICENIRLDSAVQSHIRDYVDMEVEQNVILINGEPYDSAGRYPINRWGFRDQFWVCPKTGILKVVNSHKYKYTPSPSVGIVKDDSHQYHKINGIWYELTLQKVAYLAPYTDVAYNLSGWRCNGLFRTYGKQCFAVGKRQLNSREIKKLNLNLRLAS